MFLGKWSYNQHNIQGIELRQSLLGHDGCVNALCWTHDGRYLFSGSDDSTICVWRATEDGSLLCRFRTGFGERVFDLKIMPPPNDHLLIACSMDTTIKIFDINKILAESNSAKIFGNTANPDEESVHTDSNFCTHTFAVHTACVKRIAPIPDSPFEFLSCSEDGTARHFDIRECPPHVPTGQRPSLRGGRVVADYHTLNAELYALDVDAFQTSVFAVGGTMESILVHDRRLSSYSGHLHKRSSYIYDTNWSGDGCIVRLRRDHSANGDDIYEHKSDVSVTGLRFSKDVAHQVVGSWSYNYIYLFDLNKSPTFMSALLDEGHRLRRRMHSHSRGSTSDPQSLPPIKRVRSNIESDSEPFDEAQITNQLHKFGRGYSQGIRILTKQEAPYMYSSEDSSSMASSPTDNNENSFSQPLSGEANDRDEGLNSWGYNRPGLWCDSCRSRASSKIEFEPNEERLDITPEAETETEAHSYNPNIALTDVERKFIDISFDSFLANISTGSLPQALASISFAIRQLGDQSPQLASESFWSINALNNTQNTQVLSQALSAIHTDTAFDRNRIISLLHNNRASINATMFRAKWRKRFQTYLMSINLTTYSLQTITAINDDFSDISNELASAARDADLALQTNYLNAMAHYNRLLVAMDTARFSIMMFILTLQPLVSSSNYSLQVTQQDQNDSEPIRNRLRAEFGDMSYRLREVQSKVAGNWDMVRREASAIRGLEKIIRDTSDNIKSVGDNANLACVFSGASRFFGVSCELAETVRRDADRNLGLFEQNSGFFEDYIAGDIDPTDYTSVIRGLILRWKMMMGITVSTSNPAILRSNDAQSTAVFDQPLFESIEKLSVMPHAYMWHPCYMHTVSEQHQNHLGIVEKALSATGYSPYIRFPVLLSDSTHVSDSEDRLAVSDLDSRRTNNRSYDNSLSSPSNEYYTNAGITEDNTTSSSTNTSSSGNISWPRKTSEYTPQKHTSSSIGDHIRRFASGMPMQDSSDEEVLNKTRNINPVPVVLPCCRYKGHCNFQTVKDVSFVFNRYVASGSDDGNLFVWDKDSMDVLLIIRGDSEIVNIIEGHPFMPIIAVSGIDNEVQIFHLAQGGPIQAHRKNFPLVREINLAAINIANCVAAKEAMTNMIYARDPYYQDLQFSGHLLALPEHEFDEFSSRIPRVYPAVSMNNLDTMDQIISNNEDMRVTGLAHSSLTAQIMNSIIFSGLYGAQSSESGFSASDDNNMESEGSTDSEQSAGIISVNSESLDEQNSDDSSGSRSSEQNTLGTPQLRSFRWLRR
ncbi:hypothetical protein GGI25_003162 [Coemansia spiralis]|uniref:Uncharacterized protein n=2 Tax=Coemansia TaxID=4863 RepID=A0A9W8G909_9FUNG|nr:hypothetical protein EDC05_003157 [Coemansia umbellata]KAJ2677407.1 hypothetical protein GGI25_003162 [Coemansia spiralis]